MPKKAADGLRAAYEKRPYPAVTREIIRRPPWLLPPVDWIRSVAPTAPNWPQRILVAGCGTGAEAFAMQRRFPEAEVVGVDFSAASIRLARRAQQRAGRKRQIQFLRGDLTNARFFRLTGGEFDFVSCHGVLSYVPAVERALRNLAKCLVPRGVLYLGVNGAAHFSERWRQFLPGFGIEMAEWPGGARLWRHLKFAGLLTVDDQVGFLKNGVGYLSSDLFGPVIRNLTLSDWARKCRRAGLHLHGSHGLGRLLWPVINDGSHEIFRPRKRGEIALLLDVLRPRGFHRLIFTREPEVVLPWEKSRELLRWRPLQTAHFREFKVPHLRRARRLELKSVASNVSIELRREGWEIDLLRESNGESPLREIAASAAPRVSWSNLRSQLYLFYLLDLLNFLPPPVRRKKAS